MPKYLHMYPPCEQEVFVIESFNCNLMYLSPLIALAGLLPLFLSCLVLPFTYLGTPLKLVLDANPLSTRVITEAFFEPIQSICVSQAFLSLSLKLGKGERGIMFHSFLLLQDT